MSGTYRTDFTIVPTEVGNFVIEGKPLVFFNPSDGKYHTVEVPDMPIRVLRGTGAAAAPAPTEIDAHIDDILHIRPSDIVAQNAEINYAYSSPLYWLAYVLLLIILLGTIFLYRRNIRLRSDVAGRRLAKAGRVAQRRLKQARSAMDAKDSDSFYASLASAMWGYISDKLGIAPSQLTPRECGRKARVIRSFLRRNQRHTRRARQLRDGTLHPHGLIRRNGRHLCPRRRRRGRRGKREK